MADANTGSAGTIRIDVSEDQLDAAANTSRVNWAFYLIERVTSNSTYQLNAKSASVDRVNVGTLWSGTFTFDWRPAGNQTTLIASGSYIHTHNADGTGSVTIQGNIADTGTSGAGGPTSVAQALTLTTLKVVPGTPTSVAASRNSDTQINVSWAQSSASNGQPTSNTVEVKVNGGAFGSGVSMSPATSATLSAAANEKREYRVRGTNSAGASAWSATSAPVYTTPAAPTNATAAKDSSLNIVVGWTPHVNYPEHTHEVWHGTVSGGVTTWDGSALATVASGTSTYTHATPNSGQVHQYEIRAVAAGLNSGYAVSPSVQLLTAPAKPTIPALSAYADKASIFRFSWVHNPIDSTPQAKHQTRYSLDGGSTWTTAAKTASTDQFLDYAANTWVANNAVTFQVRTKGSYDDGADGDASYSPWSDSVTVTFKSVPTAAITAPANGGTLVTATLDVSLTFAQAESATFVKATVEVIQAGTTLESKDSTVLLGIHMATAVQNSLTYSVRARVQDSNGLWSAWVTNTFSVSYTLPVAVVAALSFLQDTGFGQLALTIAAPGAGEVAATTVSITRAVDGGVQEVIVTDYPVSANLTFFDTTPTVHGTNSYVFTTKSDLGAVKTVTADLVTAELRRAYLGKGTGFSQSVVFGANLEVDEALSVASDTIEAAGRTKPIGLYGVETSVVLKVKSFIYEGFGSTIPQLRAVLLVPGKACYRDSAGRRLFGQVKGSVSYKKDTRGDLSFTLTETS